MKFVMLMHTGLPDTTGQKHSNYKMQDGGRPSFWKIKKARHLCNGLTDNDEIYWCILTI